MAHPVYWYLISVVYVVVGGGIAMWLGASRREIFDNAHLRAITLIVLWPLISLYVICKIVYFSYLK